MIHKVTYEEYLRIRLAYHKNRGDMIDNMVNIPRFRIAVEHIDKGDYKEAYPNDYDLDKIVELPKFLSDFALNNNWKTNHQEG